MKIIRTMDPQRNESWLGGGGGGGGEGVCVCVCKNNKLNGV